MHPSRELAYVVDRSLDVVAEFSQRRCRLRVAALLEAIGGHRQPNPQRCQSLLNTVVEAHSDAPALGLDSSYEAAVWATAWHVLSVEPGWLVTRRIADVDGAADVIYLATAVTDESRLTATTHVPPTS